MWTWDSPNEGHFASINRTWGKPSEQLRERDDKSDFELKTQDKIGHRP
jgi:GST-like protein